MPMCSEARRIRGAPLAADQKIINMGRHDPHCACARVEYEINAEQNRKPEITGPPWTGNLVPSTNTHTGL